MAMTKAEKAEMEALRVRAALAWPDSPPKPVDLAVAKEASGGKWLTLWWANAASMEIGRGVTDGSYQSARTPYTEQQIENRWNSGGRVSMSQGPGDPWYATEDDALRALHYGVAMRCAEQLRSCERYMENVRARRKASA